MLQTKRKKGITEQQWTAIQMAVTLKDPGSPFYKMSLEDYQEIKLLFEGPKRYYICVKCIDSRVYQNMNGVLDSNTGEVIDTDGAGDNFCAECDKGNDEDENNIIEEGDLCDFERAYVTQ